MDSLIRALRTRGRQNLLNRFASIVYRYGFATQKCQSALKLYSQILQSFGCCATIPICGILAQRYPKAIKEIASLGYEIACHGFTHINYGRLSLEQQIDHLGKSVHAFQSMGIKVTGFRGPYLSSNNYTLSAVDNIGLNYISNDTIFWDVGNIHIDSQKQFEPFQRALEMYQPKMSIEHQSLPTILGKIVNIPVSLPDDEMIIDRLGITDSEQISLIWMDLLNMSYNQGELFTLMLHPERIGICRKALENLMVESSEKIPAVWVASLDQIAKWWYERSHFNFEIKESGTKKIVYINCSDRATVLFKDLIVSYTGDGIHENYRIMNERTMLINDKVPILGISTDLPESIIRGLKEEGFYPLKDDDRSKYAIYIDNHQIGSRTLCEIVKMIDAAPVPLLRFWRWPYSKKSAFSVTGDLDSITILDYFLRSFKR